MQDGALAIGQQAGRIELRVCIHADPLSCDRCPVAVLNALGAIQAISLLRAALMSLETTPR